MFGGGREARPGWAWLELDRALAGPDRLIQIPAEMATTTILSIRADILRPALASAASGVRRDTLMAGSGGTTIVASLAGAN